MLMGIPQPVAEIRRTGLFGPPLVEGISAPGTWGMPTAGCLIDELFLPFCREDGWILQFSFVDLRFLTEEALLLTSP